MTRFRSILFAAIALLAGVFIGDRDAMSRVQPLIHKSYEDGVTDARTSDAPARSHPPESSSKGHAPSGSSPGELPRKPDGSLDFDDLIPPARPAAPFPPPAPSMKDADAYNKGFDAAMEIEKRYMTLENLRWMSRKSRQDWRSDHAHDDPLFMRST